MIVVLKALVSKDLMFWLYDILFVVSRRISINIILVLILKVSSFAALYLLYTDKKIFSEKHTFCLHRKKMVSLGT